MPVYYSLIARGRVVVCDYSYGANLESMAVSALDNLGPSDVETCQTINSFLVFTLVNSGLTYLCITDSEFSREDGFKHLKNIMQELRAAGLLSRAKSNLSGPYSLRVEFGSTMERLTVEASDDKVAHLHAQVGRVKSVMTDNIRKVTERGESIVDLADRSEQLAVSSTDFQRSAVRLRKKMMWKSVKLWVILIVILIVILLVIIGVIVGGLFATGKIKT